jgi:hypothetical protein
MNKFGTTLITHIFVTTVKSSRNLHQLQRTELTCIWEGRKEFAKKTQSNPTNGLFQMLKRREVK